MGNYRITNPEGYEPYVPAAVARLLAHGAELIVGDYASHVLEGAPSYVTIVWKFASKAAATAWYESPEYQAIKHLRTDNSEGSAVLVDPFVAP